MKTRKEGWTTEEVIYRTCFGVVLRESDNEGREERRNRKKKGRDGLRGPRRMGRCRSVGRDGSLMRPTDNILTLQYTCAKPSHTHPPLHFGHHNHCNRLEGNITLVDSFLIKKIRKK